MTWKPPILPFTSRKKSLLLFCFRDTFARISIQMICFSIKLKTEWFDIFFQNAVSESQIKENYRTLDMLECRSQPCLSKQQVISGKPRSSFQAKRTVSIITRPHVTEMQTVHTSIKLLTDSWELLRHYTNILRDNGG